MRKILQITLISTLMFGMAACSAQNAGPAAKSEASSEKTSEKMTKKMTGKKLSDLILNFDENAVVDTNSVQFTILERPVFLVYDVKADRMRLMSPIGQAGLLDHEVLTRLMQANYDAALDARYALANDIIWSVFLHPLGSLTEDDLLSGIAQTVTAAETFGTSYTSGAVIYGGGDSNTIHEDLLKRLEESRDNKTKI